MRIVAWNCNMALHRKLEALLALEPDVAVISECARRERLEERMGGVGLDADMVWVGRNRDKGLAVLGFNGYTVTLDPAYRESMRYIAPVQVRGPFAFNLLAVWAQNLSGGVTRKRQYGPVRLALNRYRVFLSTGPVVAAGDFNNNVIWDRPGWLVNHAHTVERLAAHGTVSASHATTSERDGEERSPTLYWRDRRKDGPTYHLDYVLVPRAWLRSGCQAQIGSFEHWRADGLSDHVPVIVDVRNIGGKPGGAS